MAALVPDDSLLHFELPRNVIFQAKRVFFNLGKVPPSNALFIGEEALLHNR